MKLFSKYALHPAAGFTLIEMAVVIALIGLLLGAVLTPLATQLEVRKNRETERQLREVKQALIGFAIVNGRLPCPDVFDGTHTDETPSVVDGEEDCGDLGDITPASTSVEGFLPWVTLELRPADAWGNLYRYRVTEEFVYQAQAGSAAGTANRLDLGDAGTLGLQTRGDNAAVGTGGEGKELINLATTAAALVISAGANGFGSQTVDGYIRPPVAAGTDEAENADGDENFIVRLHTPGGAACDDDDEAQVFCEFDDLVIWLSRSVLMGELVNAGVLP